MLPTIILGLDVAFAKTGYAVLRTAPEGRLQLLDAGILKTTNAKPDCERLAQLYEDVTALLGEYSPVCVGIEKAYIHMPKRDPRPGEPKFEINMGTSLKLARAAGAVMAAIGVIGLPVYEFAPMTVKKGLTGSGASTKEEMVAAAEAMFWIEEGKLKHDAADAIGVAVCATYQHFHPGPPRTKKPRRPRYATIEG